MKIYQLVLLVIFLVAYTWFSVSAVIDRLLAKNEAEKVNDISTDAMICWGLASLVFILTTIGGWAWFIAHVDSWVIK